MVARRRSRLAALRGAFIPGALPQEKNRIHMKSIPSSGEQIPVIGLGTWQTFDVGADAAARAPLREVLKLLNGNLVDSSPMYRSSETVPGDLISQLNVPERPLIPTKAWTRGPIESIQP